MSKSGISQRIILIRKETERKWTENWRLFITGRTDTLGVQTYNPEFIIKDIILNGNLGTYWKDYFVAEYRRHLAAFRIQQWWHKLRLDPRHPVGIRRLEREYLELFGQKNYV